MHSLGSLFSLWMQFTERSFFYLPPWNVHPLALVLSLWSHSEQIGLFLLLSLPLSYFCFQESGDSSHVPRVCPSPGCIATVHSAILPMTVLCTLFIWLAFLWACSSFASVFVKVTEQCWRTARAIDCSARASYSFTSSVTLGKWYNFSDS